MTISTEKAHPRFVRKPGDFFVDTFTDGCMSQGEGTDCCVDIIVLEGKKVHGLD